MTSSRPGSRMQATRHHRLWSEISMWLVRAWRGLIRRCVQAQRIRRDVKALSALNDDQLKDIGLARGEIGAIVATRARLSLVTPRPLHPSRLAPMPTTTSTQTSRSAS